MIVETGIEKNKIKDLNPKNPNLIPPSLKVLSDIILPKPLNPNPTNHTIPVITLLIIGFITFLSLVINDIKNNIAQTKIPISSTITKTLSKYIPNELNIVISAIRNRNIIIDITNSIFLMHPFGL